MKNSWLEVGDMTSPKVSVVVPVYNLEFYIERCLESLAQQTLEDIEVIVVNDGGVDDSQIIIDDYVQKFPSKFKSYIKPNGGHGAACNYGIDRASGEYIIIVDGDDFLDHDSIEFMYHKAKETGADLLIGNLLYCYTGSTAPFKPLPFDKEKELDSDDRDLLYKNWATPCGRMYHRSIFADPDVRLKEGIIFADANFVPKSYLVAKKIYYVDKELYNYDVTRPTQSMKQTDKRVLNIVVALEDMIQFYKKKGEFENFRKQLQWYTARHCVGWIARIRYLEGYDKLTALRELFAVPEKHFGRAWVKDEAMLETFGRKEAKKLALAQKFNYSLYPLYWNAMPIARKIDSKLEYLFSIPVFAYRKARNLSFRALRRFIA
jgi:glycosyltransferase involved in cell wall biosynthesis